VTPSSDERLLDHPPRNGIGVLPVPRLTAEVTGGLAGWVRIAGEKRPRRIRDVADAPDARELKRQAARAASGRLPRVNYCGACGGAGHHRGSKKCGAR
jgi:hypothetical protein